MSSSVLYREVMARHDTYDLLVVGGGVMGLFTAEHAARLGARVAVVEQGRIGDPLTASFGRTRSFRNDYLDAAYARLAHEAYRLWGEFERRTGAEVLVRCGCLNLAKRTVTPDLDATYAQRTHEKLLALGLPTEALDGEALARRYPDLDADLGRLDPEAGVVDVGAATEALTHALRERGVDVYEGAGFRPGDIAARALVVTAGHGTNDVLAKLPGTTLQVPLAKDRPSEAKYFTPPPAERARFTSTAMPVIAYLDTGIYLHPIVDGLIDAVKIGYYNPPDMPVTDAGTTGIDSISDFIEQCLPGIAGSEVTQVTDVDQCDYDLVADDNFVLGAVPGFHNVFVGVGWRGTGYKFAPWVGRVLSELALREGTVYDIGRFSPARFATSTAVVPEGESS
jgi:glycine/D-amino acid oxidase-like deaminating enzyme